ncbi:hypothetical protein ACG3SL_18140 [Sphingomonas sp. CJ20]
MMQPPPTRYKVVERGRRLLVIDSWTGAEATKPLPAEPAARGRTDRPPRAIARARHGTNPVVANPVAPAELAPGDVMFTTRRWYDDRAPRRIRENFSNRSRIERVGQIAAFSIAVFLGLSVVFWPYVPLLLVPVLATKGVRDRLRGAITRGIDALDQAGASASVG